MPHIRFATSTWRPLLGRLSAARRTRCLLGPKAAAQSASCHISASTYQMDTVKLKTAIEEQLNPERPALPSMPTTALLPDVIAQIARPSSSEPGPPTTIADSTGASNPPLAAATPATSAVQPTPRTTSKKGYLWEHGSRHDIKGTPHWCCAMCAKNLKYYRSVLGWKFSQQGGARNHLRKAHGIRDPQNDNHGPPSLQAHGSAAAQTVTTENGLVPRNSSSSQTDIPGAPDSDESMSDDDAHEEDSGGIVHLDNALMADATAGTHRPSMLTGGTRADDKLIFSQTAEGTADDYEKAKQSWAAKERAFRQTIANLTEDHDDEQLKCKMERAELLAKLTAAHGLQTITEHSRHRVAKTLLEVRDKIHDLYKDADSDMQLRLAEIGQDVERSLYLEDLRFHGEMEELG